VKKKPLRPDVAAAERRRQRIVRSVIIVAGFVLAIDALVGEEGLLAIIHARREYQALEQALEQARAENAALREESRRLREDPDAIEDLARRELGLIRPGERLFIIRDVPLANQRP
jgi:cell division protein FtsB